MSPFFGWLAIVLVSVGVGLLVYSLTVNTVEQNGKDRSSVHWVYILLGLIFIIIGLLIMWRVIRAAKEGGGGSCRAGPGEVCQALPVGFAQYLNQQKIATFGGIQAAHANTRAMKEAEKKE